MSGLISRGELTQLLLQAAQEAGSIRKLALILKVSPQYLGDVIRLKRGVGPKVLTHLNLHTTELYKVIQVPLQAPPIAPIESTKPQEEESWTRLLGL